MSTIYFFSTLYMLPCWSRWPRVLRRRSAAARQLRLWVWISPEAWMSVSCECCVLSGRGLCDELITRPEESYRTGFAFVCDVENLMNEKALANWGLSRQKHTNMFPWCGMRVYLCSSMAGKRIFCALGLIWQQQFQHFPPSFYVTSVTYSSFRVLLLRHFQHSFLCHISPCSAHVLYCVP
jgi:hypothetical protein